MPNITRIKILVTIYACYIWDAMRSGYIQHGKELRENHRRKISVHARAIVYRELCHYQRFLLKAQDDQDISYCSGPRLGETGFDFLKGQEKVVRDQSFDRDFACPLPVKPKIVRMYQIFSNCFVTYSMFKYALLASMHYGWLDIEKTYACYIPGRLGLTSDLADEVLWFGFMIFGFHVAWRLIMSFSIKRVSLDCFMFLLYDRETILDRQLEVEDMNSSKLSQEEAYRRYLCNRVFYERLIDSRGRLSYVMKPHRTIEHYEKLKSVNVLFRLWCILTVVIGVPVYVVALRNQISHDFFDPNYSSCRSFASSPNTENFKWSFRDKFRLFNLIFDRLDNLMLAIDSSINLILPFVLVTLSHDLTLRLDDLCDKVSVLNDKFRHLFSNDGLMSKIFPFQNPKMKIFDDLRAESRAIFNEVVDTFNQVERDDEFMRTFTLVLVYVWFFVTMSANVFILMKMGSLNENTFLIYMIAEFYWHTALASLLALMTRPHNRAKILYNKLCSAMALCPNEPEMKITWHWLVEYYHEDSSRYALHFVGKAYALSNLNILRCMSWFVSCTVIMVNLIRNRMPDQKNDT